MMDFFFEIFKSTNEVIIDSTRMTKFVECLPVFVTKLVSFMESYNEIDRLFECYDRFRTAHVSRMRDVRSPQRIERWIIVEKFINVSWQYPFERFSNKQELEIRFQHLFRFMLGIISQKLNCIAWIVNPGITDSEGLSYTMTFFQWVQPTSGM